MPLQKRTVALVLALVGAPTLLSSCRNKGDCDPRTNPGCNNGSSGGRTGYYGGGGYRGGGDSAAHTTRGGFGSFGRGFFSGG